ncbi:MAG: electron transport complex subunit RsxE [Erysipelotrichaceae bacterium]
MWNNFKNGFIKENPVFGLYLGLCSSLAISTSVNNAIGMGACVTIVLILSNCIVSLIRKITPSEIRIPVYIVVIASLVTVVEMVVHAFMSELYTSLGVFLSLIVVNCIILGRAEAFASKNGVVASAVDGLGMGLGYTFALLLISVVRELVATAGITIVNPFNSAQVLFSFTISALEPFKISLFSSSVGAFLTFACFAAFFAWLKNKPNKKEAK